MSSDVFISAVKPADDTWKKHKAVWDACQAAGVDVPRETDSYFEYESPDPDGISVDLGTVAPCSQGTTIDLNDLPKGTRYIKLVWG